MPRALKWILPAVGVLVIVLAGLSGALWLTTRDRPQGALDTELEGVTVSEATTPVPTGRRPVTGDKRCWRFFGGDPQRSLARPFARLGLPARTYVWTRGFDGYIEYPPSYCEGRLYVNTDRKSTRLNSSHIQKSRMPSSA